MNFLRNLGIRQKLMLFFGVVCLMAAGVGVLSMVLQSRVTEATVAINEKWLPGVRTLDAMHSQHSVEQRAVLDHALCNTADCMADHKARYFTAKQNLADGFQQYQKLLTTDEERELLAHLDQLVKDYDSAAEAAMATNERGDASVAEKKAALAKSTETYEAAYKVGDDVIAMYNKGAGEAAKDVISLGNRAKTLVGLAILLTLAVAVLATMMLTSLIATPLRKASEVLKRVSQRDLTQMLDYQSADEVGEMAVSLNTTLQTFHSVLERIQESAQTLADSTQSIGSITQKSSDSARQQADETNNVATAMHEMSATVVEVGSNSRQAADAAEHASETARAGGAIVGETLATMRSIASSNAAISGRITELGKSSEKIGTIAGVIDDIADQTNLLALNAAIEAARAGEQGRGFAVVADEVRKLAERTASATKEIAEMIECIQNEAREAVNVMQAGTREVELGVQKTEGSRQALDQIIEMATSVGEMVTQIASAATEQSTTAETINANVANIASMTQQASQNAGETAKSCNGLSALAGDLLQVVDTFQLKTQNARRGKTSLPSAAPAHFAEYEGNSSQFGVQ
ncbi:MAG: methyl-accepting chemotaxis protein [Acidobacteriota bacterium]|nr:methyl-accepting chemotaxis protein [Acidobacteriota bacterium]